MLFLIGLSCFAETVTVMADDGTLFEEVPALRTPVSSEEMKGAAFYVVSEGGRIISMGRLKAKASAQAVTTSADFIEKKIPTQQWRRERIEVREVEIFSMEGCPYCVDAKTVAAQTFGEENVKVYKIDGNNPAYQSKSQAILKAVGQPNFPTVPRISVIGKNGVRYFLGGYDQLKKFITSNKAPSMMPQSVSAAQADGTNYLTKLDMQTRKWNREKFDPIQIEIVGTKTCPYCVKAKALALKIFGSEKTKEYNYNNADYAQRSEEIMNAAGMYNYGYIPRVSVIAMVDGEPVRFVLGGYSEFASFVNRMNRGFDLVFKADTNN